MLRAEKKDDYLIGKRIDGKYEIIKNIGQGRFGKVYAVKFENKEYALKIIPAEDSNYIDSELYFADKNKNHENEYVVKIYDAFITIDYTYACILMDLYLEGNLRSKIDEKKEFEFDKIYKYISNIVKGLDYLHNRLIIHRDIKPENILLRNDQLVLADFGLCRILSTSSSQGQTQVGTFEYFSPEIEEGQFHSFKTDIWSAGCVLFELITLKRLKSEIINLKNEIYRQTPFNLKIILKRMLSKQPKRRADSKELCQRVSLNLDQTYLAPLTLEELKKVVLSDQIIPTVYFYTDEKNQLSSCTLNSIPYYLERDDLKFENLQEIFSQKKILVVHSSLKCGKTTLLKRFAFDFHQQSQNNCCYFLNSNDIHSDLKNIANILEISIDLDFSKIIAEISNYLELNDSNCKCLFLIDDLTYSADFNLFRSVQHNVKFLIATKESLESRFDSDETQFIELKPFSDSERLAILKARLASKIELKNEDNDEVNEELEKINDILKINSSKLNECLNTIDEAKELDSFGDILDNIKEKLENS